MNYLLDTHALIWFLSGDNSLSSKAKKAIESSSSIIFVSIASIWEMAIKVSLDRLDLRMPFAKLKTEIENNGFQILPITFDDIMVLNELPLHHRDPFDRLLISQAIANHFTIISKDKLFIAYKANLIW